MLILGKSGGLVQHRIVGSSLSLIYAILSRSDAYVQNRNNLRFAANAKSAMSSVPPVHSSGSAVAILERFRPLFAPRSIAVVGASANSVTAGNEFIRRQLEFGFSGNLYPIHPSADRIGELPAFRSVADAPEPIDYAFVAVAANQVRDVIGSMAGRVRFAQIISSGFGEIAGGDLRERALLAAARDNEVRLIGPNCLGTYSPSGRLTFTDRVGVDPGTLGIISQSGGLAVDIVLRGKSRGLLFRGLVSIGNAIDLGAAELLEYYVADPATNVIGIYLETARDGRRLFDVLRRTQAVKPVVILKGGRTTQGHIAAASHTGALAGDHRVWQALAKQTGCLLVRTLDEFIDVLLAFQMLSPRLQQPTSRLVLFGNGGGTSVLAADCFAEAGLDICAFAPDVQRSLADLNLPAGSSVANPVDMPASALEKEDGQIAARVLNGIFAKGQPDAVVIHLNVSAILNRPRSDTLGNLIRTVKELQSGYPGRAHVALVLRSDGERAIEEKKQEYREQLLAAGIPVFDEMPQAANAFSALCRFEQFHDRRRACLSNTSRP